MKMKHMSNFAANQQTKIQFMEEFVRSKPERLVLIFDLILLIVNFYKGFNGKVTFAKVFFRKGMIKFLSQVFLKVKEIFK